MPARTSASPFRILRASSSSRPHPNTNAGTGQRRHCDRVPGSLHHAGGPHLIANELSSTEVREEVFREYNEELDAALSRSIWSHRGMTTCYRNDAGRVVISSPWKYIDYWQRTLEFDRSDYVDEPRRAVVTV